MPLKLRLRRMGRKKRPIYAVVAADSRSPRDGRFIEDLGRYNPIEEPAIVDLKDERILYWLDQGAQPTDTVRNLLSKQGLLLGASLHRKGRSDEEIQAAIQQHREARAAKTAGIKLTAAQRRQQALEAERKRVAEAEAETARQRAEANAEAKRQAEEAKRREAEERLAAQENAELPPPAPVEEPAAPENNAGPNEIAEEPQAVAETAESAAPEEAVAELRTAEAAPEEAAPAEAPPVEAPPATDEAEAATEEGNEKAATEGGEPAEEKEPKAE